MAVLAARASLTPTDAEYFEEASRTFQQTAERAATLLRQEAEIRTTLRDTKAALEARDGAFIRNGLSIDGRPCKNAEEREAALGEMRFSDAEHRRLRRSVTAAEIRLADILADLERARDERSLAKARMAYARAMLLYLAGADGEGD